MAGCAQHAPSGAEDMSAGLSSGDKTMVSISQLRRLMLNCM